MLQRLSRPAPGARCSIMPCWKAACPPALMEKWRRTSPVGSFFSLARELCFFSQKDDPLAPRFTQGNQVGMVDPTLCLLVNSLYQSRPASNACPCPARGRRGRCVDGDLRPPFARCRCKPPRKRPSNPAPAVPFCALRLGQVGTAGWQRKATGVAEMRVEMLLFDHQIHQMDFA